jgi:hypothetical protein
MPWFKVDDHFHSHPKVKKCGLAVVGLWTVSGSYCMAHLTDGFVEEWFVREWRRGTQLAATLVAAGLWYETTRNGEKGWQFHDWDKYQPTKKQVEAEREKSRNRKAAQRLSQGESHRDSGGESQGESRQTPGTVAPPPPDPSFSLVDLEGRVTESNARGNTPPPQFCPRHPHGTDLPCGPCGQARKAFKAWESASAKQRADDELDSRRRERQTRADAITACPLCDETGNRDVEGRDYQIRCNHQVTAHG